MKKGYEIFKGEDGHYWLVSEDSYRYDTIKSVNKSQTWCYTRGEALSWFSERGIPPAYEVDGRGFFEIYV